MYLMVKHFHITVVGISVCLLTLRYILMMMDSPWRDNKVLKILPHINDTLLLFSGVALIAITRFVPFTPAAPWLTEKLAGVVVYIALGFFALKLGRNKLLRSFAFFGALGWLYLIVKLANTKATMFFG